MSPRILVVDVETSPHLLWGFGLFKQDFSLVQIEQPSRMITWAAKWSGESKVFFGAEWKSDDWLVKLHELLSEADAVCHYNGRSFDMPIISNAFREHGLPQTSPMLRQIDLLKTVRKFRLASSKLDWAGTVFLDQNKLSHSGFKLWKDVMHGDERAQRLMERYNRQDVVLTDKLLLEIRPFVKEYPSEQLHSEDVIKGDSCNRCGSTDLERRGYAYTDTSKYQQFRCRGCGAWSRSTRRVAAIDIKGV